MTGMRFCPSCGQALQVRLVDGRERGVCEPCHIGDWGLKVVSVGIAIRRPSDGAFLLGRRAEPPAQGRWALPGGYVEGDELLHEAVVREAREETGVDVEVGPVIAVRSMVRRSDHDTYVVFLADHVGGEPTPDEHEFDALEWFDRARLEASDDITPVSAQILLESMAAGHRGLARRPYERPDGTPADLHLAIAD